MNFVELGCLLFSASDAIYAKTIEIFSPSHFVESQIFQHLLLTLLTCKITKLSLQVLDIELLPTVHT